MIYKSFIEAQFKYCPLTWMFHSRLTNNKVNRLHERALRLVYNDYTSSFEAFLSKDRSFSIHHQNIQSLAIEIYKVVNNVSTGDFKNFLQLSESNSLRSQNHLVIPQVNTVLKGKNSIRYFGPVIWNLIPHEIRNLKTLNEFKEKIKTWKPDSCPCRLCLDFIPGVGFSNISA